MGIPKSRSLRTHTPIISSMKFLVILALAVAVSAEADPQLMYNTYGAGWPITSYVQKPLVSTYVKPVVYTKPLVYTKPVQYHAASPGVSHTVLKREAEPYHHVMPVTTYGAMPAVTYTSGYYPYTHGVKTPTYSNDAVTPFGYAGKGQYVANSAGVVHVAKREAEADAQMILPVTTYGHSLVHPTQSVVYKQAVQPVVYKQAVQLVMYTKPVVPLVYNTPIVQKVQPVKYMASSYADDSVKSFDYAAKGKYMANSAGTIHKAKREAEAEADPALIYSGLGYHGLGYRGIYSPVSTYSYGAYPYSTYHYGKREAEAEPQYYGYNGLYNGYSNIYSPYTYGGLRTYGGYTGRYFW